MVFHLSVSEDLLFTVLLIGTKCYTCAMEKDMGTYTKALSSTGQSRAMSFKEPKVYISPH